MTSYQIRADVFPATITIVDPNDESVTYDKVRVILTLDHVFVFKDDQPAPSIAFEDRLTSYTPPVPATRVRSANQLLARQATFATEDGYSATFTKMSSCGCGSRLKTASLASLMPNQAIPQAASTNDPAV